ncbi:hypothetical protein [Rhizobium leguminosarum]|uniref:hypothetical protein n=1 Tax=Rhizobium leguminosarum TaxID=384 RepID=UPI001032011D|nr:hypothetical protein [Rhizobium leguminosarum]TBG20521.1 hypothetical protein ELG81_08110 [Rhizobium leguminosarum]TBG46437.1 hypothetical protein ELG75_08125 [Rhizobium leguminosarum]TBG79408.1 hypothetical protein ELG76_08460 [Rhizobium leguminosarum]
METSLGVDHQLGLLMEGEFCNRTITKRFSGSAGERLVKTEEPPPALWLGPVIEFLSDNLPGSRKSGWDHAFITAYQIGCEALVALGQADETAHGAVPRENPALPAILPRWDDLATAVICLAAQNGLITFLSDVEGQSQLGAGTDNLHQTNRGMWAASSNPEVTRVLRSLRLLDGNEWTAASETIMWRDSPTEWRIDFSNDPRFIRALDDACKHMPDSIRAEKESIAQITDAAVAAHSARVLGQDEDESKPVWRMLPKTPEQVKDTIRWMRRHDFDELFYKFWRIGDGWLSRDKARRALEIFNDPLAIAMRKAVAARLFPHWPHLAE